MEKALDREGAPAPLILSSFRRTASRVVAVCYSLYAIIGVSTFLLEPLSQLAIFFSFSMTASATCAVPTAVGSARAQRLGRAGIERHQIPQRLATVADERRR